MVQSEMSEKSNWLNKFLGKYWFIQITLIGVLVLYSLFTSVSLVVLVNQNNSMTTNNQTSSGTIILSIIFESKDSTKPITWNSVVMDVKNGSILYNVMNSTFTINGTSYGSLGFLITQINTIQNQGSNVWTYYYFMKNSGWTYSPIGVSSFHLNQDSQIKWVYGPASS